jgi:hypothetical protein
MLHLRVLYKRAQELDGIPGENYDGTTVRGLMKALKEQDLISEYHWAWGTEDLVRTVLELGPVVVGTDWHRDMYVPDSKGFVTATGSVLGGHAWVINGVNKERGVFRAKNSWGRDWGIDGRFWIRFEDMEKLLNNRGEAVIATEK